VEEGLRLEWESSLQVKGPREFRGEKEKEKIVEKTHREFMEKGVVEEVPHGDLGAGHFSVMFPVPKKGGKWRGVLDLRELNEAVRKEHFKMEGLHTVREALRRGDWMTSLDIQDAYNHIPVAKEDRPFLRYTMGSRQFQFRAMPFGLTALGNLQT